MFEDKLAESIVLGRSWALFIDGGIIVIWSNCSPVVVRFIFKSICASSKSKIRASVNHIHGKGVAVRAQKLIIRNNFFYFLSPPLLSPMGHPPWINLSSKYFSIFFEFSHFFLLLMAWKVVNSNVGSFPMAFMDVFNPVNIVLRTIDVQIVPHLSDGFHIGFVSPVEPKLVLDLQHYNASLWMLFGSKMILHDWDECFEIHLCLSQKLRVVGPNLKPLNCVKSCRHSSEIPLCTDIRSRPKENHHPMFFGHF